MSVLRRKAGPPLNELQRRLVRDPEAVEMVERIAKTLRRRHKDLVDYDDLVQLGHLGLSEAAQTYRSDSGVAFADFAWRRVYGAMRNALGAEGREQRLAAEGFLRFTEGVTDDGDPLRDAEADQQRALHDFSNGVIAMGALVLMGAETLAAHRGEERMEARRRAAAVRSALASLPDKERDMLWQHYVEERSLADLISLLELPNEARARRLKKQAEQRFALRLRATGVVGEAVG